jgi:hypothetical protein
MRKYLVPILLMLFLFNSSWQCMECVDWPSTQIDDSRNWLPLKGKTAIVYVTSNGTPHSIPVRVIDTTERYEQCVSKGSYYSRERIDIEIFLDSIPSGGKAYDRLSLSLGNVSNLIVVGPSAYPDPSDRWYYVFSNAGNHQNIIPLNNYRLNNTTYPQVILLKSANLNPLLDSIILARNYGIAGFKYKGVSYSLP